VGYYTRFTIKAERHLDDVIELAEEISGYTLNEYSHDIKWYSHVDDMRKVSLDFPDNLITLEGVGEEDGDMWKKYFYNGKCQVAEAIITYEPFDPLKLQ